MDSQISDQLAYLVWIVIPVVVLIRFRKAFYALYIEDRNHDGLFSTVMKPFRVYAEFKKAHIESRNEWAEKTIEQEKYRKSAK